MLWDEAANTGQVPQLEKLVAVIRSREVSLCLLYQQLDVYKRQTHPPPAITLPPYRYVFLSALPLKKISHWLPAFSIKARLKHVYGYAVNLLSADMQLQSLYS